MDGFVGLLLIVLGGAFFGYLILRAVWHFLTTDWFGIYYDDPTSPYYHDKTGKGRGR